MPTKKPNKPTTDKKAAARVTKPLREKKRDISRQSNTISQELNDLIDDLESDEVPPELLAHAISVGAEWEIYMREARKFYRE